MERNERRGKTKGKNAKETTKGKRGKKKGKVGKKKGEGKRDKKREKRGRKNKRGKERKKGGERNNHFFFFPFPFFFLAPSLISLQSTTLLPHCSGARLNILQSSSECCLMCLLCDRGS